jgi:hypothetical protein
MASIVSTIKEWSRYITGKYDYQKFARHDPDEYEKKNKEPNRKAGKALGNVAIIGTYALLISVLLFGLYSFMTIIFGVITVAAPTLNFALGLKEKLDKQGEKYLKVKAWDMKERLRSYFFPEYDWGPLQFIPDDVLGERIEMAENTLKLDLLRTDELTDEALSKMNEETVRLREKVQTQKDRFEQLLMDKLKALPLLKALQEEQGPWYQYSFYPEKRLDKQCIMVFRHEVEKALDSNIKGRVAGYFKRFNARLNEVEAILAGTVEELLLSGFNDDEVQADIPDYVLAIKKETPIFVIIMCDADRRAAIRGLMPKPPSAALLWLIRVIKSMINLEPVIEELERKDRKVLALEESKEAMIDDQKTGIVDWRQRHGQLYPIPDTEEEIPEYVTERVPLARRQAILILVAGIIIGAIIMWYAIPFMGYRLIPLSG